MRRRRESVLPRIVIAGISGDGGKTLVTLGLSGAFRKCGLEVAPFKKGPDFIDAAWLGRSAGRPARNLDSFLMSRDQILRSFVCGSRGTHLSLIEGNRGLFDGLDEQGTHSTAELAKMIRAPLLLVLDVTKMTRTAAALVAGCQALDRELQLAGVILNRVGTARQERIAGRAIREATGLPLLGAIPRLREEYLPSRHLGLVTVGESSQAEESLERLGEWIASNVDLLGIRSLARQAPPLEIPEEKAASAPSRTGRVGVLRDAAFSFYYPENLESLKDAGLELEEISPLESSRLPEVDLLYAGGGFPEEHAPRLVENESLRRDLRRAIEAGMPVWAECGGLIYLCRSLLREREVFPMVDALPLDVCLEKRPQGHGYIEARVNSKNPFWEEGTRFRAHEFHYSRILQTQELSTAFELERGCGVGDGRDGLLYRNVMASYAHIHASGCPEWTEAMAEVAGGGRPC